MKRFRSVLFWCHLATGASAGVVILVMSFTGVVLALKPQILSLIERDVRFLTPQDSPRQSAGTLMTAVRKARPEATPVSLSMDRDPGTAVTVNLGRDGNVYVNPYTGAILGASSARAERFFQSMTSWHRYLGATGEYRTTGRAATGASNLAFLALGLSGLYLWWPRQMTWRYLKPIVLFRAATSGRARDFNWHNVIGFWCLPAIVIMTASGAVISYPWASNLVYLATGSPVPARGGPSAGPGGAAEGRGQSGPGGGEAAVGRGRGGAARNLERETGGVSAGREGAGQQRTQGSPERRGPDAGAGPSDAPASVPPALDLMWARAEQQVPSWSLLSLRLPNLAGAPVSFTITDGQSWNRFARSQLTLDSSTGDIVQWQPYDGNSLGQKARGWLRFAHTGELGGLTGQIVAGVGCLGGVMLVWTGLSLAFRRLWLWSVWKRVAKAYRPPAPAGASEPVMQRVAPEALTE